MLQIDEPTNQLETVDMVIYQGTNPSMSGQRFSLQVHNIMRKQIVKKRTSEAAM
jgi:pentose-5-phosphate-3-epimerase